MRACLPVPNSPTVLASARASFLVATPLAAPVRNWPSRSASTIAVIPPCFGSNSVTWNCAPALQVVYALKPSAPSVFAAAGRTCSMT